MAKHYCQYCNQELITYKNGQKFCSPSCMSEYYKEHPDSLPNAENLERRVQELERQIYDVKKEIKKQDKIYKELKSKLK